MEVADKIKVNSKKSQWIIKPGLYVYVGSAMATLTGRVKRHLTEKKKNHWHIDFLTSRAKIFLTLLLPSRTKDEKVVSQLVSKYGTPVKGFGSTDCKGLNSNLYRIQNEHAVEIFKTLFSKWRESL